MGGIGSGRRWRWDTKDTTEDHRTLDVRRWHREKLLTPNQSFVWKWTRHGDTISSIQVETKIHHIILTYRHQSSDDGVSLSCPVCLSWTSCNYGNQRPWFLCPAQNCGRRVQFSTQARSSLVATVIN